MDAYLYIRMSTKKQLDEGRDSLRRQTENADTYIRDHPELKLQLVDTIKDPGVSAFRGKNFTGELGRFIDNVQHGQIKTPCTLLLEDLSRWSRDEPIKAAAKLFELVDELNVTLIAIANNTIFSRQSLKDNPWLLLNAMMENIRSNTESLAKSQKTLDLHRSKRDRIQNGDRHLKYSGMTPSWLILKNNKFEPITGRIKTINYIFDLYVNGRLSSTDIMDKLNSESIPPFNHIMCQRSVLSNKKPKRPKRDYWSSVQEILVILKNRALIGEGLFYKVKHDRATGKRKRIPATDPIQDYYPEVIDKALFLKAQQLLKERTVPRRSSPRKLFTNLFTGISRCGRCGSNMIVVWKNGKPYLACHNTRIKHTTHLCPRYVSWHYLNDVEPHILDALDNLDWSKLYPGVFVHAEAQAKTSENALLIKQDELKANETARGNIVEMIQIQGTDDQYLQDRYSELRQEKQDLESTIKRLMDMAAKSRDSSRSFKSNSAATQECLARFRETMANGNQQAKYDLRRKLNALLRETVDRIVFTPVFVDEYAVDEIDTSDVEEVTLNTDTDEIDISYIDEPKYYDERHIKGWIDIEYKYSGGGFSSRITILRRRPVSGDRIPGLEPLPSPFIGAV